MKDQQIIDVLRSESPAKGLQRLYRYYPKVKGLICGKGGQPEDADDIFQDALMILCKKAQEPSFQLTSSLDTFLFSVCKFLWNNEGRKRQKNSHTSFEGDWEDEQWKEMEAVAEKERKFKKAEKIIAELGERCKELLLCFYHQAMSMKEIAVKMRFSSEKVAKNQKYKCLERAKNMLREA
ncbi:MAG: RNA polymerase sigma factor (sigma-70 family) [Flavobacteriales bacterium]|jgi:RNA polymerase sigma factor (sigma-70 family)